MQAARRQFKACFTGIGQRWPEHCETLEREVRVRGSRGEGEAWGSAQGQGQGEG